MTPRSAAIRRMVVLTGAGISAESGLATFRDPGGVWQRFRPQDLATPEAFARDPDTVLAWYDARRAQLDEVAPNTAHLALARLDAAWPHDLLLVTQNVDDLHVRAGSRRMVQMHGALRRIRCEACGTTRDWHGPLPRATPCPACGAARLRPDVVWFGEMPQHLATILPALESCDLFLAIGTSGTVHPAAGFVGLLPPHAHSIEINPEPSAVAARFRECRRGPATQLVPPWVEEVLALA